MRVFILCGGYYRNFEYPKSLTKINGEALVDRTIRLLTPYDAEPIVCCNPEETAFDDYHLFRAKFTFDYLNQTGYYLDAFDAVPCEDPHIFLFGDVYYTEDAISKIMDRFHSTDRNIFICNRYPFNPQHLRQGEPFGWIVKDPEEFRWAIKLGKRFQDRGLIDHARGIPSNWELYHIINGMGVNEFNLSEDDCLVIDDLTIDVDDPGAIEKLEKRIKEST